MNADGRTRSWVKDVAAVLTLVALTVAVFGRVAGFEFLWDDEPNIPNNPYYYPTLDLRRFWVEPYLKLYIPVAYTVWGLLVPLAGPERDAGVFHVANLVLHVANVVLVYALLRRVLKDSAPWAVAVGAAVFAVHPLQVEPVAWVSELRGLLSVCLSLGAIHVYLSAVARRAWPARVGLYVLATTCFGLAMLSKPSAVTVPLVLGAIEVLARGRSIRTTLGWVAPWLVIAVVVTLLTQSAQPVPASVRTPAYARPLIALDTLGFYLWKFVWPMRLAADYGRTPQWVLANARIWPLVFVPIALIAVVTWRWKTWPALTAGVAVAIVAVAPVLGLVPFIFQTYSTVADRYVYLAMLGPALGVAWVLSRHRRPSVTIAAAIVVAILAARSFVQVPKWRDAHRLFAHTLVVNPHSVTAHTHLGAAAQNRGDPRTAIEHFRAAVTTSPGNWSAWVSLGSALRSAGDTSGAIDAWTHAYRAAPEEPAVLHHFAIAHDLLGRPDRAAELYRHSLALDPRSVEAHINFALNRLKAGTPGEAVPLLARALELRPDSPQARIALGMAYHMQGHLDDAVRELEAAIERQPDNLTARWNLALVHYQRKDADAARRAVAEVLARNPNDAEARRMDDLLRKPDPFGTVQVR